MTKRNAYFLQTGVSVKDDEDNHLGTGKKGEQHWEEWKETLMNCKKKRRGDELNMNKDSDCLQTEVRGIQKDDEEQHLLSA